MRFKAQLSLELLFEMLFLIFLTFIFSSLFLSNVHVSKNLCIFPYSKAHLFYELNYMTDLSHFKNTYTNHKLILTASNHSVCYENACFIPFEDYSVLTYGFRLKRDDFEKV